MKRFLLFAGCCYYPNGGLGDLVGSYDNDNEAIEKTLDHNHLITDWSRSEIWWQIYDQLTDNIIEEYLGDHQNKEEIDIKDYLRSTSSYFHEELTLVDEDQPDGDYFVMLEDRAGFLMADLENDLNIEPPYGLREADIVNYWLSKKIKRLKL